MKLSALGLGAAVGLTALLPLSSSLVVPTASDLKAGASNFKQYKSALPESFNVVEAGGWHTVFSASADPKETLVASIASDMKMKQNDKGELGRKQLDLLLTMLQCRGMGFDSSLWDGEWATVMKVPLGKKKDPVVLTDQSTKSVVDKAAFLLTNQVSRGKVNTKRVFKYNPVSSNFSVAANGSIVLRRVTCKPKEASWKFSFLPKIPMLRRFNNYVDTLYLDKDICITQGKGKGVQVAFRPEYLESIIMASAQE